MTPLGQLLLGLNWKCLFLPFTYPITYKVVFWYFRSLCIGDTISSKTYQNFRDQKSPIWQRSKPISYKAEFSQRDDIYLVDLKYNTIYHEMPKIAKKLPYNLHRRAFYKIAMFVLTKKGYQQLTTISIKKVWLDPKVNPQIDKNLNP